MKLLFIINTSAQAYTWKNVILDLRSKGNDIKIIAREYGSTLKVLDSFGFEYSKFRPVGTGPRRFLGAIDHFQKCYQLSRGFDPSIVMGFGIDAAVTATRLRKRSISFIDDEPTHFQNEVTSLLSSVVITPDCFKSNLGKKQVRIKGYKELAYLHPNYFEPDPTIFNELKIDKNDKYVVIRFNAFDAAHDVGRHGFSIPAKYELVNKLKRYCKVFISEESILPPELEIYKLNTSFHRIHHVLNYANLVIGDTGTMITEAALLGTPGIQCNNTVGQFGNFVELERDYGLLYMFNDSSKAIEKSLELIQQTDLKEKWAEKRQKLLDDKIDVTQYMIDVIESLSRVLKR